MDAVNIQLRGRHREKEDFKVLKLSLAVLLFAGLGYSDSIEVSMTVTRPGCYIGSYLTCAPMVFSLPQLPQVDSATFEFTDTRTVRYGTNTMYRTPGQPYSLTMWDGVSSDFFADTLGHTITGTTDTGHQIGLGNYFYQDFFDITGTIQDLSPFIGEGSVLITISDYFAGGMSSNGVLGGITGVGYGSMPGDVATLTLIYDPITVPEPRYAKFLLYVFILLMVGRLLRWGW